MPHSVPPVLVVIGGLPRTGKTTVARRVAQRLGAASLRVDTIEQALRDHGSGAVGIGGYAVAYALAAEQLALGLPAVVECVNPLAVTRDAWADTGRTAGARTIQVELACTDRVEHRRRVETRTVSVPNLVPPTWDEVLGVEYEPWAQPSLSIDTATVGVDEAVARILHGLGAP